MTFYSINNKCQIKLNQFHCRGRGLGLLSLGQIPSWWLAINTVCAFENNDKIGTYVRLRSKEFIFLNGQHIRIITD